MEYHSPYVIDITISDIPSFIFSPRSSVSKKSPQYFDAENPTKCYSLEEAEIMVKRVAKGIQNLGLRGGERVLLVSGNQLHFPVLLWGVIAAGCIFTGCTTAASVQGLLFPFLVKEGC
jgi:4-coumarate--CoA ligase